MSMASTLSNQPIFTEADVVAVYWPILNKHEIDTRCIIRKALETRKNVLLPVMKPQNQMAFRTFDGALLYPDKAGIFEPDGPDWVESIDLIIAPCLAVDSQGNRLGYGGGFYDRFLANNPTPAVCMVPTRLLMNSIPTEEHDVPVDWIITEKNVLETKQRRCNQTRTSA